MRWPAESSVLFSERLCKSDIRATLSLYVLRSSWMDDIYGRCMRGWRRQPIQTESIPRCRMPTCCRPRGSQSYPWLLSHNCRRRCLVERMGSIVHHRSSAWGMNHCNTVRLLMIRRRRGSRRTCWCCTLLHPVEPALDTRLEITHRPQRWCCSPSRLQVCLWPCFQVVVKLVSLMKGNVGSRCYGDARNSN